MKHLWLAGLLLSSALIAKPGDHAGIFNHFDEDVTGGQRIENPNGLPEDEASRQRRYYREWGAYNKMINLYLADHPTFVILPPPPFEPEDPAKPTAEEKAAHEAQVLAQKNQRDVLTSPDPVKAIEQTVKFSVDNAVAVFKKRNPNATAVQIEAYRKKAAEGYRQQFSMLYRRAMADITLRIKFGDLHKLKKAMSGSKENRENFEAVLEERKAFPYEAAIQIEDQMVTEESEGKPVFPVRLSTNDRKSMQELWDSVMAAKAAEEARVKARNK